jgi:hypothetical protein
MRRTPSRPSRSRNPNSIKATPMILGPYLTGRVASTREDIARMRDTAITHEQSAKRLRDQIHEAECLLDFLLKGVVENEAPMPSDLSDGLPHHNRNE